MIKMRNLILLAGLFFASESIAVCSSPLTRTNFVTRELLTSARLNNELNAIYSQANELPGDCIANSTITSSKILDGTLVNADISDAAAIDMKKVKYSVAIISDTKLPGVSGGAFTGGSVWRTRDINTEVDPDGIVSISSNQFTLAAGTYLIKGSAPAFQVDSHKAKIYNVTSSSDAIVGTTESSLAAGSSGISRSFIEGLIIVPLSAVFEVRHSAVTTNAFGFGGGYLAAGVSEVYTILTITKIK